MKVLAYFDGSKDSRVALERAVELMRNAPGGAAAASNVIVLAAAATAKEQKAAARRGHRKSASLADGVKKGLGAAKSAADAMVKGGKKLVGSNDDVEEDISVAETRIRDAHKLVKALNEVNVEDLTLLCTNVAATLWREAQRAHCAKIIVGRHAAGEKEPKPRARKGSGGGGGDGDDVDGDGGGGGGAKQLGKSDASALKQLKGLAKELAAVVAEGEPAAAAAAAAGNNGGPHIQLQIVEYGSSVILQYPNTYSDKALFSLRAEAEKRGFDAQRATEVSNVFAKIDSGDNDISQAQAEELLLDLRFYPDDKKVSTILSKICEENRGRLDFAEVLMLLLDLKNAGIEPRSVRSNSFGKQIPKLSIKLTSGADSGSSGSLKGSKGEGGGGGGGGGGGDDSSSSSTSSSSTDNNTLKAKKNRKKNRTKRLSLGAKLGAKVSAAAQALSPRGKKKAGDSDDASF